MLMYVDFFCSFTMPPGYLQVSLLGYHPPPATGDLLGWVLQCKHRWLQWRPQPVTPEHRLDPKLPSQRSLVTTPLTRWTSWSVPPPSVPAVEAKLSFVLVVGRERQQVGEVRCLAGRSTIFKESGWGKVRMQQWGWVRETSVWQEQEGGCLGFKKLLGEKGWQGWMWVLQGAAEGFGNKWGATLPISRSSLPSLLS